MMTRLTTKDVQSLKQRFPYMFAGEQVSLEFYKGWFPDLVDLCFELDALLGEHRSYFQWIQIKEKFGNCRMYFTFRLSSGTPSGDGIDDDLDADDQCEMPAPLVLLEREVRWRVSRAAQKMNGKCMVCGDAAATEKYGFWLATLCPYHHPDAREARSDTRTLEELSAVPLVPVDGSCGSTSL